MARIVFLLLLCAFVACDPVIVTEDETPTNPGSLSSVKPSVADSFVLSVEAAIDYYSVMGTCDVWVKGYVVGCVAGTSISKAQFMPPFDIESNLLIADAPDVTEPSRCLPVTLLNGSVMRRELNLIDHPSIVGRRLLINGKLDVYFRQAGIKKVYQYELLLMQEPALVRDSLIFDFGVS